MPEAPAPAAAPVVAAAPARAARSLQARLLLTVLGLLLVVWSAAVAFAWFDIRHELDELLDGHLAQAAAVLASRKMKDSHDHDDFDHAPQLHKYQSRVVFQIWHKGQLQARSANAPVQPLVPAGGLPDDDDDNDSGAERPRSLRYASGFSDQTVQGQPWRVFATPVRKGRGWVVVGEMQSARQSIAWASLRNMLWPLLLALPVLALAIWWAVRQTLQPLRALGRQVAARQPASLQALAASGAPPEVQPLVNALNGLFARMSALLESERRFTADAAHELRTPIAAIRMQAQVAQGAHDDASRQQALAATLQGCDRATRLVEQLLQLARLEAQMQAGDGTWPAVDSRSAQNPAATDAVAVTAQVVAELQAAAAARGQHLHWQAPDALSLPIPAPLLQVLVRNLLDNALRYSPDGATASLQWQTTASAKPQLQVQDSGPGLDQAAQARLGERFFRVLGSGQSGSGLGWSIVRRIARLQGLSVQVDRSPALGGLRVRVDWP